MDKKRPLFFKFQHPTFGTKHSRRTLSYQQRSIYYWFYQHLRRNKDYLDCCANNGNGKLADLYKDFGDVRVDDFKQFWAANASLFAEQQKSIITDINTKDEFVNDGRKVIALSFDDSKKELRKAFNRWLKRHHTTKRGRKPLALNTSTAKYPIHKHFDLNAIQIALDCYDKHKENEDNGKPLKQWQLAETFNFRKFNKDIETLNFHRNVITALFKRYRVRAEKRINAVANGIFPIV